jgi:hypothetical protein
MTRHPTRADEVRAMSSQGSRQPPRQAKMTAIDMDDDTVRPDSWFVYVMPVQMGVEMIGSGRYGYWDERPEVKLEDDCIVITDKGTISTDGGEDEPIMVIPKASVITVMVATSKHIQALPFPVAQVEGGS